MLQELLGWLVPHLPADAPARADLQQRLAELEAAREEEMRGARTLVIKLTPEEAASMGFTSAAAESGSGCSSQRRQAATPEAQQLAVRCAQALGLLKCANPRCASLAGASEAASRGRKCGGCHAVRYCSEACSKADWRQHRVACRLLQQEAGGG